MKVIIFDAAKCNGCHSCQVACKDRLNSLSPDVDISGYDVDPDNLSAYTWTLVKLHKDEVDDSQSAFVKVQCMHCVDPVCASVCPVGALEKTEAGPVVYDAEKCFGCRYCMAACPYQARRFNWHEPEVPANEVNLKQHYLGNRKRTKGVTEKCTFCIQRSREGLNPACAEACPTGARVFGNLLDPKSEIRYILANKKIYRLKEDLGTEPKFWYFSD